ncbi:MAG: glycoside hydrolase family 2 protein [Lachnospiraceae bacterium]|nr:glycoside hydrolase family 2 protein [Lachnospiraceae bacterium]
MIYQTLNGTWLINEKGSEAYVEGKVPGSVLSALLMQHRLQDPFYGLNEYSAKEIFRSDFYFTREFEVMPELMSQERIYLCCKGIDTLAKIYINEMPIGRTENMHRTYYFNITGYLRPVGNRITIEIDSPLEYIENIRPGLNKSVHFTPNGCIEGNQRLRKSHSMLGWSHAAQLPDCGIWRSIDLVGCSYIKLDEIEIIQHHEKKSVTLEINVNAEMFVNEPFIIQAELISPEGRISAITETMIDGHCTMSMEVESPKIWWPNGFGEHPLYTVSVYALDMNGNQWDSKTYRIGLRTISISRETDEWGSEFCLKVNGVKIFAMGADYVPEDSIYSFITKEKIDYLLKACVRSNFNMIRVWGGGYYPSDTFYDLCDEYGIIVWQDLMFADNIYELNEEFRKNIESEIIDNIKRIRSHASLGLICGNSGIESDWVYDENFGDHSGTLKDDYRSIFEELIPDIMEKYAPSVFYWPSTPSSGGNFSNPANEDYGDSHYWGVWKNGEPIDNYYDHKMRFCSEYGCLSYPSIKTVKSYTKESDRNLFSEVMESHVKEENAGGRIMQYISREFLYPKDFESLLYITQIVQGLAVKKAVEHMRRNRGRCMGSLFWQLNDSWPVASCSSIDYYGRFKALQYMAKGFYASVAGSIYREGNTVSVYVQNETRDIEIRRVRVSLQTFEFRLLHEVEYEVEIKPFEAVKVCEMNYTPFIEGLENRVFMEAVFIDEDGNVVSTETEVFVPYKRLMLDLSSISYSVIELVDEYVIRMMSGGFAAFVELDLKQADAIFSDNFFHLTSKREKAVRLKKSDIRYLQYGAPEIQNGYELEQQLVIRSLKDTF